MAARVARPGPTGGTRGLAAPTGRVGGRDAAARVLQDAPAAETLRRRPVQIPLSPRPHLEATLAP